MQIGQFLQTAQGIILFIVIIGILVIVHELGHYLAARRFGVEAPEFGIGFPPRLWTFWKTNGLIEIQGKRIVIPKKFQLPDGLTTGSWVTYKTETQKGKEVLTAITPIDEESRGDMTNDRAIRPGGVSAITRQMASQVQLLDRGTEFTLNAIPFGGYVRMNEDDSSNSPNAFVNKPAWQRGIILLAGVAMNFLLAFLVFIAVPMMVPQMTLAANTNIVRVNAGSPAAIAGLSAGDIIVAVNGVDVNGSRQKMANLLASQCGKEVTLGIERPNPRGPAERFDVQLTPRPNDDPPCIIGVAISQDIGAKIANVAPGSIGEKAGLRAGDSLVRVGDFDVLPDNPLTAILKDENALAAHVADHYKVNTIAILRYIRDGEPRETKITIPADIAPDQANLGLSFRFAFIPAIGEASTQMYTALTSVPRAFRDLFANLARGNSAQAVGPIGMTQIVAEGAPSGGLPFLITVIGVFSLNLAIFNLLPIPALDGGRLVFVFAEIITRGRKLDPRKEGIIHLAGFVFLLMMIFVISYFDVTRLLAGKSPFGP
jgi:regulator of sigma E protease